MNIQKECYRCIFNQVFNVTNRLNLDEQTAADVLRLGAKNLAKYDLSFKPPEIAGNIYGKISKLLNKRDLFEKEKKTAIKEALKFKPILKKRLQKSENILLDACKIAVSGNVIDLGVNQEYNLEKEIKKIFQTDFYKNDFYEFEKMVLNAKNICYLADNAGENVFDEILIEVIKKLNLNAKIYYVVRGKPIINDVTADDLKGLEINKSAKIINSGVNTPGFYLAKANKKSREIFYNADIVISKGMGNFECLYNECDRDVFYIFKVKCNPVAVVSESKKDEYMLLKGIN